MNDVNLEIGITEVLEAIGVYLAPHFSDAQYRMHFSSLQRLAGEGIHDAFDRAKCMSDGDVQIFRACMRSYGRTVAAKLLQEVGNV